MSKPTESVFEDVEVAPLLRSLLTEYLEEFLMWMKMMQKLELNQE